MSTIKLTIKELQRYIDDLDSLMQTGWFPNKKVTDYTFYHRAMSLREFISKGREIIREYLMNEIIEITGVLTPYHSGRSIEYKFEPNNLSDDETELYYDNNWEQIEEEILDKFSEVSNTIN